MLSKYLTIAVGGVILVGCGAISQAEVTPRVWLDDPASSTGISKTAVIVAAREVVHSNSLLGEEVDLGQKPEALRLAALSYEPAGLYAASGIPKILSDSDIIRYGKIFELQQLGM